MQIRLRTQPCWWQWSDTSMAARLAGVHRAAAVISSYLGSVYVTKRAVSSTTWRRHRRTASNNLIARSSLADWTGMAGNAARARDQYAVVLPIFERVTGPERTPYLTIRGNFARWTEQAKAAGPGPQISPELRGPVTDPGQSVDADQTRGLIDQ
jgi:hypothetical protein